MGSASINMEFQNAENFTELLKAQLVLHHKIQSIAGVFSVKCAVELGIADRIHAFGRPMPLSDLARSIPIAPEKDAMLRRVMRLLVNDGVFGAKTDGDGHGNGADTAYFLTPISRLLLTEGINMGAYACLLHEDITKPMYHWSEWFTTEKNTIPFEMVHGGKTFWDMYNQRNELNQLFNDSMASLTRQVVKGVVTQHPEIFHGIKSLVDVGGGNGTAASIIAEAFPDMKCTVFDLPHVIATLPEMKPFNAAEGDMFQKIPPANAIFLKEILHDWSDAECVTILKRCKEAIPPKDAGGKVIIVDIVITSGGEDQKITEACLFSDILMMNIGGKERDEQEWGKIIIEAGFTNYKITPMFVAESIIELYP